ncbi:MAG: hypothetical protein E7575_07065 [Ruminococcaceae bacterium]|nr:hypothetical protein [Oscillospiraceae bacterium]
MKRGQRYFLNAILLSAVTIIMRGVSVSFNAYVTQKIGSEAIGLFTLVMSVYTLAVTVAASGVNLSAVRMTAECLARCTAKNADSNALRKAMKKEMGGCFRYSAFFGIFASLLLYILSDIIGYYLLKDIRTVSSLKILSFALLPISLTSAMQGYFTGLRKIYKNAFISVIEQLIKITVTTMALISIAPKGIEYACLAVVGGSAVSEGASLLFSVVLFITDRNKAHGNISKIPDGRKSPLTHAFEIAFPVAAGSYVRQGLLCAEHIAIPAGLRRYGAGGSNALSSYGTLHAMAFPLIFFPSSVIGAFASLLIPELTECNELGQKKSVENISKKVVRFSLLFSIGCAGVFFAFGYDMGTGIYNNPTAGTYICAIAPLVPVMYLDTAVDSVLKGLGQQFYCMKVNIIDASLSLLLVLILVPRFGTYGYIACVYIAEIVNAALSIWKMLSCTGIKIPPIWILKPLLSVMVSATAVKALCSYFPIFDITFAKILLTFLFYSAFIIPKGIKISKKSYKTEKPLEST